MDTSTKNRRRQVRFNLSEQSRASVEFVFPRPGGHSYKLPILNLSSSGLSFAADATLDPRAIEEGATLAGVTIRVGECTILGELLVMHVTTGRDSEYLCGALFFPATDTDLVKHKSVIAGMEAATLD